MPTSPLIIAEHRLERTKVVQTVRQDFNIGHGCSSYKGQHRTCPKMPTLWNVHVTLFPGAVMERTDADELTGWKEIAAYLKRGRMAKELAGYLHGWIGYYGKCETPPVLRGLEEWTRRRPRSVIWRQWKRGSVRFAALPNGEWAKISPPGRRAALTALEAGEQPGTRYCAAHCSLRLARDSAIDCRSVDSSTRRTARYGPVRRVV